MKEIHELNFPDDLRYTAEHEWARLTQDHLTVGITDFAQDRLGDVVFVDLPQVGSRYGKGDSFGTVESVKAVSELFMPVAGEIVAVNARLADNPELVNQDPYQEGWMIQVNPEDPGEWDQLLDQAAYLQVLNQG